MMRFFEPGNIRLRNAHDIRDLLLRLLLPPAEAETHGDDLLLPFWKASERLTKKLVVDVVLQRPHNDIAVCAEHIGQQ